MKVHPLTPERWPDFEKLFGPRGAYGGCWCMWWRSKRSEFERNQGEGNRRALRAIVDSGRVPGILAYEADEPIAWCSVAPRSEFGALNRSRVLGSIDDRDVWSIVCFFVAKGHRGRGVLQQLLRAAVEYVESQGGDVVEAYPSVTRSGIVPPTTSFMGFIDSYRSAGFVEVARPSDAKRIMRFTISTSPRR